MRSFRAKLFKAATDLPSAAVKPPVLIAALASAIAYRVVKSSDDNSSVLATNRVVLSRGNQHQLIDGKVDLSVCPTPSDLPFDENCQLTIGDLHANAMKLIYFLLRENVLISTKEDYDALYRVYQKSVDDLTGDDIKHFNDILQQMKVNTVPAGAMVRLIGDELCDRGRNDYFVLAVMRKLHNSHVPFVVLFSNHGSEFLQVYEKSLLTNKSYLENYEDKAFGRSLTNMRKLVVKGIVPMAEVDSLVREVYFPHLRLLSCTIQDLPSYVYTTARYYLAQFDDFSALSERELIAALRGLSGPISATIYTHAPVGLNTLRALADPVRFDVPFSDVGPHELGKTVSAINEKFSRSVRQNRLLADFGADVCAKVPS